MNLSQAVRFAAIPRKSPAETAGSLRLLPPADARVIPDRGRFRAGNSM